MTFDRGLRVPGKAFLSILTLLGALVGCGDSDSSKPSETAARKIGPDEIKTCPLQLTGEEQAALQDEPECYGGDDYVCSIELLIYDKTNELRSAAKGTLAYSAELSHAAREWSRRQASAGKISHDGFPTQRYESIAKEFDKISVTIAAENVGLLHAGKKPDAGFAGDWLASGWWKSPGHKKNILLATTHIGVGVYQADDGTLYATQIFGCE